jgi:hypothetical protein
MRWHGVPSDLLQALLIPRRCHLVSTRRFGRGTWTVGPGLNVRRQGIGAREPPKRRVATEWQEVFAEESPRDWVAATVRAGVSWADR